MIASRSTIGHELPPPSVVLYGVTWEAYQALRSPEGNNHLRMTFDRGELEIMSPSKKHEQISYLVGRMIDEWTIARDIEIHAGRTTTFCRQDLDRGLEPDNCYWIAHEALVREFEQIDLSAHPPPDLALEVDVTSTWVPKLPIYQALGVPEVWRWRDEAVEMFALNSAGVYERISASVSLPGFPHELMVELLRRRRTLGNNAFIREFRRRSTERPTQ
jgi:Uma2 family endonuclease